MTTFTTREKSLLFSCCCSPSRCRFGAPRPSVARRLACTTSVQSSVLVSNFNGTTLCTWSAPPTETCKALTQLNVSVEHYLEQAIQGVGQPRIFSRIFTLTDEQVGTLLYAPGPPEQPPAPKQNLFWRNANWLFFRTYAAFRSSLICLVLYPPIEGHKNGGE